MAGAVRIAGKGSRASHSEPIECTQLPNLPAHGLGLRASHANKFFLLENLNSRGHKKITQKIDEVKSTQPRVKN